MKQKEPSPPGIPSQTAQMSMALMQGEGYRREGSMESLGRGTSFPGAPASHLVPRAQSGGGCFPSKATGRAGSQGRLIGD